MMECMNHPNPMSMP